MSEGKFYDVMAKMYLWKCESPSKTAYTVEPRYLELAYFELPFISKWKSDPCFNMIYDNR